MTKQPNRIQVKETTLIDRYIFEGKLEEIIEMLQDWKNEGEWEGVEVKSIGYDGAVEYYLYKHRPETDEEYDKRMKLLEKENRQKVKEKEKRRIQYEMLKKEFEDT
jgi:wyosine [tRNA(Phe)-imidazoG37] synthetase (radical SAM superfamily)